MVYRIYVEKKKELANEAASLFSDIRAFLQIQSLEGIRILNRYDVENIDEELFNYAVKTVFSEPQLDITTTALNGVENSIVFATEYLPGQFDQRADSAAQCIQIISQGERPLVKTARVYVLSGSLSKSDISAIKKYVINPVESREASLDLPKTLVAEYDIPTNVAILNDFLDLDTDGLSAFVSK